MKAVTGSQMRELDRATIEEYNFPGRVLMENAGRAVADAATELLPPGGTALIFCGKGNNGGDGFVTARHLVTRGYKAHVALLCSAADLSGDAASNCQYAAAFDIPVHENPSDAQIAELLTAAHLLMDAVLGTGISGPVHGRIAEVLALMAAYEGPTIAVDIPSGLNADTGALLGAVPAADITVTFGLAKQGLYLYPGHAYCGRIRVAEICLCPIPAAEPALKTYVTEPADVAAVIPIRAPDAHKGDAGRVLVIAGSTGLTGAAAMSALAAARSGAGLVTLACPGELNAILETKCTEVMTAPLMDDDCGFLRPRNIEAATQLAADANAVVLGPGLGTEDTTREFVAGLLAHLECPVVLDADGLNAFAGRAELLADCPGELVITPHPGELSRLTGASIAEIQADRLEAARRCAEQIAAAVVLKGAGTVTAAPDGEAWINPTGNCGMASGGMGDILSGMIGALLAAGAEPLAAAYAAVWMHGRAADIAADEIGPRGYLATDLLELIPSVFDELHASTGTR